MTESTSVRHVPSSLPRIDSERAVVEQAKGALMLRFGINSHEAFALLLTWSRDWDATLHTIAHSLVNGVQRERPTMAQLSRALRDMTSQEVARGNAAAAAADLKRRRLEREDVDAYLLTRRWRYASATDAERDVTFPNRHP